MENPKGVEYIKEGDDILAVVLRSDFSEKGVSFVSKEDFGIQFGIHVKEKGSVVPSHAHFIYKEIKNLKPQEAFVLLKGKIKVDVFGRNDKKHSEVILNKGESILLNSGHGIEFLEDSKMMEFKQGPYREKEQDKYFI